MKRFIIVVALALGAFLTVYALMKPEKNLTADGDSRGHVLTELWKQYDDAVSKDRPKKQSEIAQQIIAQATKQHLSWDFYDGWQSYIDAESSINWRTRDDHWNEFAKAAKAFDEPIVTFFVSRRGNGYIEGDSFDVDAFLKDNSTRLKATHNEAFYTEGSVDYEMAGQLSSYISNDYEYILWYEGKYEEIKSYLGDTYPDGVYAEYKLAKKEKTDSLRRKAIKLFAEKYSGKALSLYAKGDLLQYRYYDLSQKKSSTPAQYKALDKDCKAFETERKSYTGKEAKLVSSYETAKNISESLNSKDLRSWVANNKLTVLTRNVSKVKVSLSESGEKEVLYTKVLENGKKSFYVADTLTMELPPMNDGDYTITSTSAEDKNVQTVAAVTRYSISAAVRSDSEGWGIYIAEQNSGRPIRKADLILGKNGSEVTRISDFSFGEGFTRLPDDITKKMTSDGRYTLWCSFKGTDGLVKKSDAVSLYRNTNTNRDRYPSGDYCNVYTDRGAYNPGDTLSFKGIFYSGDLVKNVHSASAGLSVKAVFLDSQGNEIETKDLKTNEYGSVAGEFAIPSGLRNGMFTIQLSAGKQNGHTSVRVDEFVLPTFSIAFDEIKELYLPGDTVKVTGKIETYSGHSIAGSNVTYSVTDGSETVKEGTLVVDPDGHFSLEFPTDKDVDWNYYNVKVKVIDGTGETQEASKGVSINKYIDVAVSLENTVSASCQLKMGSASVVADKHIKASLKVRSRGETVPCAVTYEVKDENNKVILSGNAESGDVKDIDLSSYASGLYSIVAKASVKDNDGKEISDEAGVSFIIVTENDKVLNVPVKNYFRNMAEEVETGESMKVQFGSTDGPVWAVVELFGDSRQLLEKKVVYLSGNRGKDGSLTTIEYEYKEAYPDAVLMQIFYFKDSTSKTFTQEFRRHRHTLDLPLEWASFEDKTLPGHEYTFILKTAPSVEVLAAIYDKSVDRIHGNQWKTVSLRQFTAMRVNIQSNCGRNSDESGVREQSFNDYVVEEIDAFEDNVEILAYDAAPRVLLSKSARSLGAVNYMATENVAFDSVEADAAPMTVGAAGAEEMPEVEIREEFAKTLAFEPFLRSGKDGKAELKFRTSDKLSTFNVRLYAHDKDMKNAYLKREMVVTIPVKVSVTEPKYLYVGDKYSLAVNVSSNADEPVAGTMYLYQYDGKDYKNSEPVKVASYKVTVPAKASLAHSFEVAVPENAGEIGLKAAFVADDFSDGLFVSVPVYETAQILTEAHSAVILPGMDKEAELEKIRQAFVNTSYHGAEYKEISIIDMVKEAIPTSVEPKNDDVLSLSEAYYVRKVAASLGVTVKSETSDERIMEKILACRNSDGGFGWFEGMDSSPVITAVLLERFAKLRDSGLASMDLDSSVKYLDDSYFRVDRPFWCGGISMEQYLFVRSLYPGVEFNPKDSGNDFAKRMKEFRKDAKEYLVPKKERGLSGAILAKARRLRTLSELAISDEGIALAGKWGVTLGARRKMLSSLEADVVSLKEYAADHKDGGMYYPNAVMPLRGLLESEAYAHSMICDLFTDYAGGFGDVSAGNGVAGSVHVADAAGATKIADGIRIWLMLQKETQKWGEEPAFVDALNSVLAGSDEVKATKVIVMTKTYQKPFNEIKAAGNGFTIERKFYLNDKEIKPGVQLHVGDRIRIDYNIWNGENRSFVLLKAPREATLRPVNQLSGMYGWGIRPLRIGGWFSFQPHGYRNVKADGTEFYFDSYPEDKTTISEEFYVIQAGTFNAPVVEIESLYAPHYRANGGYDGPVVILN